MKSFLLAVILTLIYSIGINAQNLPKPNDRASNGFYLTDDKNRMYYETYGSGKTAILFVHGWSVTCRSWDDQIDFFKDRYKVVLVDLPGFGSSDHNRQDWSMQHYGADVAGLCRKLKLKNVYLVGWSLGTAVVLEAAKDIGKSAKTVIIVDQLHQTNYVFNNVTAENWFNTQVSMYKDFTVWNNSFFKDSIITSRYISLMPPEEKLPIWWKPSIIEFFKWRENSLNGSISELKIPIRAINASNEKSNEEQWKSLYRDYKMTVFENSNHFLLWQYPQKFNETLLQIIGETTK